MKKTVFVTCIFFLLISLGSMSTAGAQTNERNKGSDFSGTYYVTFTVNNKYVYRTKIGIEDLKNGNVKVIASYNGIPFSFTGKVTGNAAQGGATCRFAIKYSSYYSGKANIIIMQSGKKFSCKGQWSGRYADQGEVVTGSGKIEGIRKTSILPPSGMKAIFTLLLTPFGFSTPSKAAATIAAMLSIGAIAYKIINTVRYRNISR